MPRYTVAIRDPRGLSTGRTWIYQREVEAETRREALERCMPDFRGNMALLPIETREPGGVYASTFFVQGGRILTPREYWRPLVLAEARRVGLGWLFE